MAPRLGHGVQLLTVCAGALLVAVAQLTGEHDLLFHQQRRAVALGADDQHTVVGERRLLHLSELEHIARGVLVADAICKRTEIEILASRPISGGKHLIYLRGGVAAVGLRAGLHGSRGAGGAIAPNEALIFELELLEIVDG